MVWMQTRQDARRAGGDLGEIHLGDLGDGEGVDREFTMALYRESQPQRQGVLRHIIGNGVWTTHARSRLPSNAGLSPVCPYCAEGVPERLDHIWWVCPAWSHIRRHYFPEVDNVADHLGVFWWPNVTRFCGIFQSGHNFTKDEGKAIQNMMVDIYLQRLNTVLTEIEGEGGVAWRQRLPVRGCVLVSQAVLLRLARLHGYYGRYLRVHGCDSEILCLSVWTVSS